MIGICLSFGMLYGRGGFEAENQEVFLSLLCDALFVPGVLLAGTGLLAVVSGAGAFDALHYGLQKLFSLMRREEKRAALPRTYFDYVQEKHGKHAQIPWALLLVGLLFLCGAGIVLILYYRVLNQM